MINLVGSLEFLEFSMPPLQIVIRGTIMYWLLFSLFRFVLRRDVSSAGLSGILFVVLLGDAAQNAMIGDGHTILDGIVLIATLAAWNYLLDYLGFHFRLFTKLTDPQPLVLVRDGRLMHSNLRKEHITRGELDAKLRGHGLASIDDIKIMRLESDGSISVIRKPG